MDVTEYKHYILGLIFLTYVSDTFKEIHSLPENLKEYLSDPEYRDEYISRNVFWDPLGAR